MIRVKGMHAVFRAGKAMRSAEYVKKSASVSAVSKLFPWEALPHLVTYFRELRELALQETLWIDKSFSGKATNEQFTGRKVTGQKATPCKAYEATLSSPPSQDASYINIQINICLGGWTQP